MRSRGEFWAGLLRGSTVVTCLAMAGCAGGGASTPTGTQQSTPSSFRISATKGDGQVALTIGEALPADIEVTVLDGAGRSRADVDVSWSTADSTNGRLAQVVTRTGADGRATNRWTPSPRPGAQTASASIASGQTVQFKSSFRATAIVLPGDTMKIALGDTVRAVGRAVDSRGAELSLFQPSWSACGNGCLLRTVGSDVVLFGTGFGQTTATVALDGVTATVDIFVANVFSGRVLTADGAPVPTLYAHIRSPVQHDSALVQSSGTFRVLASRLQSGGFIERWLDAPSTSTRLYFPSYRRLDPVTDRGISVVIIPLKWKVASGALAGRVYDVDPGNFFSSREGRYGPASSAECGVSDRNICGWGSFPLDIVFSRQNDTVTFVGSTYKQSITAADSIQFWQDWRGMEDTLGITVGRPATWSNMLKDTVSISGRTYIRPKQGVEVGVGSNSGTVGGTVKTCSGVVCTWSGYAHMTLSYYPRCGNESIWYACPQYWAINHGHALNHEMQHVLGFGHTCNFPSIMSYAVNSPASPCLPDEAWASSEAFTLDDVGHFQITYALYNLARTTGATWTLHETINGQRAIMQGLVPLADACVGTLQSPKTSPCLDTSQAQAASAAIRSGALVMVP